MRKCMIWLCTLRWKLFFLQTDTLLLTGVSHSSQDSWATRQVQPVSRSEELFGSCQLNQDIYKYWDYLDLVNSINICTNIETAMLSTVEERVKCSHHRRMTPVFWWCYPAALSSSCWSFSHHHRQHRHQHYHLQQMVSVFWYLPAFPYNPLFGCFASRHFFSDIWIDPDIVTNFLSFPLQTMIWVLTEQEYMQISTQLFSFFLCRKTCANGPAVVISYSG